MSTSTPASKSRKISVATLRLYTAMEQRQRRFEMENFLTAEDPTAAIFSTSSSPAKVNATKRMFPTLSQTSALQYIVDAVDAAEEEALTDPKNFPFFTLILAPSPLELKSFSPTLPSKSSASQDHHRLQQQLIASDPAAITADLLPFVCDYVNARLASYNLQSISLPTLKFCRPSSSIVTEILLRSWITSASSSSTVSRFKEAPPPIHLKNLFVNVAAMKGDSFFADFAPRDYSTIVEALKQNRVGAVEIDRRRQVKGLQLAKASTEIEWCPVISYAARDPVFISEVELGGKFGKIIASESKRRYRLMQIELDEMVPLLVGMLIGAQELQEKHQQKC